MTGAEIAIIGMEARLPGANNLKEYWRQLRDGQEAVEMLSDAELRAAGETEDVIKDPHYVRAYSSLKGADQFDAGFFGFSPQDAAIMDPQHRILLEVAWSALERAGYHSEGFRGNIGVFAACGMSSYMMHNLVRNRQVMETVGEWLVRHTGNDANFLATRISYEMNLRGPSVSVQTACSSALVAVHLAAQSLLLGECDMALAGGSTLNTLRRRGYLYKPGEILSPDGHCRPFDAKSAGTVFGNGAGMVVLRRLNDALEDGDHISAVLLGSAINNDGSMKVGYLAPSVEGQSKAVAEALAASGVNPETISFVEAHGTGTHMGDPIEVAALTQAYRQSTSKRGFCALGSVKSSIGHLGEAAGAAGLIKTILALENRQIPATLHYNTPNPQIDFDSSPFFVNSSLFEWEASGTPRRAGVTALGAGGTNCHVILEEPPEPPRSGGSRPVQLITLSAKTPEALRETSANLAVFLKKSPDVNLADVAFTLSTGRKGFEYRRSVVAATAAEAAGMLSGESGITKVSVSPGVVFLFTGQGAQYAGMAKELYEHEASFKEVVDECAAILRPELGVDLREVLYAAADPQRLMQTAMAQPALFVIEYAMAKLWMSWGVKPAAMLGHSVGEYVAACLAGVFSLEDALRLVAARGRLMQGMPSGRMLAVHLSTDETERLIAEEQAHLLGAAASGLLPDGRGSVALCRSRMGDADTSDVQLPMAPCLALAAVNAPRLSVVSGTRDAVEAFEARLRARGVECQALHTSHAFHSPMMDAALEPFRESVRRVKLQAPAIPFVSGMTGTWIGTEEAASPDYWVRQLRQPVRFSEAAALLLNNPNRVFIEMGPGNVLSSLVRQQPLKAAAVIASLPRAGANGSDVAHVVRALGHAWDAGVTVNWRTFWGTQVRRRVPLPTYAFQHKSYWIEPDADAPVPALAAPALAKELSKKPDIADWFYKPSWRNTPLRASADRKQTWLVFAGETQLSDALVRKLADQRECEPLRLRLTQPGDLESLDWTPEEIREPGLGEVEIDVRASALNFADVLKATGAFPEAPFGMECAGIIRAVGAGVTDWKPGDEVVAIGPESHATRVIRDARFLAPKPAALSFEESAALPAAYMTAWYALKEVAQIRPGERILIHAASGGVGLAAVEIAQRCGAEIFATAGSEEKRSYLRSLGVRHIFHSRTLDFAREVMDATAGEGVDVILNSLTGEFIPKSIELLRSGGQFLEIGKKEILDSTRIEELRSFAGVTYAAVDLTRTLVENPAAYGALLRAVIDQVATGSLRPLPSRVFGMADTVAAFEHMVQTRHIGKVVLKLDGLPTEVIRVKAGRRFVQLSPSEFEIRPASEVDYDRLLETLGCRARRMGGIAHLWNVTAKGVTVDQSLERGFFSLTALAKAISRLDLTQPIDLLVVSNRLHTIAGETEIEPAKATILGPCRVIPREVPNIRCRSVDMGDECELDQLVAELQSCSEDRTVAYRRGDRWVESADRAPIHPVMSGHCLQQKGVYLITGGLGGIALELARHLAGSYQARLALFARTALPPRGDWQTLLSSGPEDDEMSCKIRTILDCERQGAEVLVLQGDVCDALQVQSAIRQAQQCFGPIHGVFHTAGVLNDGLIQLKETQTVNAVLAPKVQGTLTLMKALEECPPGFVVLFSSVSSLLGLEGQVDYTAANAFLDAVAQSKSGVGSTRVVSINWGAWKEAGLAAAAAKARIGADRPQHPWLESRSLGDGGEIVFDANFSRARQWLMAEHVVHDADAVLPGTGYLELIRSAFAEVHGAGQVEIRQIFFQSPFVVGASESRALEIVLQPSGEFTFYSNSRRETHVTGKITRVEKAPAPPVDIDELLTRCSTRSLLKKGDRQPFSPESGPLDQEFAPTKKESVPIFQQAPSEDICNGRLRQRLMDFGPRWSNVRSIRYGNQEALISLSLDEAFRDDLKYCELHPALLDMATGAAQRLIPGFEPDKTLYVPFSYGSLTLRKALPRVAFSHVRLKEGSGETLAAFDVTICETDGTVCAEIEGFVMRPAGDALRRPDHAALLQPESASSKANEALAHGILSIEGMEALERILDQPAGPQVFVSPVDLGAWLRQTDVNAARSKVEWVSKAKAGDSIQSRLVEIWKNLLGVESVGAQDDFFEIGGHSLLLVRMATRIEKEFGQAIPLSFLFQNATIQRLSEKLAGLSCEGERPQFFVPFNEKGSGPAFFCVHSMGGDTLFRSLAQHLHPEQRFYGIQVPQELRNFTFTSSVETMAARYVEELIQFQPEGPYLLGGKSAGASVALEMAQQLRAKGKNVELLVSFDGAPLSACRVTKRPSFRYAWRVCRNFRYWVTDDLAHNFSAQAFAVRLKRKYKSWRAGEVRTEQDEVQRYLGGGEFSERAVALMENFYLAICRYAPKRYEGNVLLFRARTEPLLDLMEVDLAWRKLASRLDVVTVPGNHSTLLDERHVVHVAGILDARLAMYRAASERAQYSKASALGTG